MKLTVDKLLKNYPQLDKKTAKIVLDKCRKQKLKGKGVLDSLVNKVVTAYNKVRDKKQDKRDHVLKDGEKHAVFKNKDGALVRAQFAGPGTDLVGNLKTLMKKNENNISLALKKDNFVSEVDKIALTHDIRYGLYGKDPKKIREADKKMISRINEIKDEPRFNTLPSKLGIQAKILGETTGILARDQFTKGTADMSPKDEALVRSALEHLEMQGYGKHRPIRGSGMCVSKKQCEQEERMRVIRERADRYKQNEEELLRMIKEQERRRRKRERRRLRRINLMGRPLSTMDVILEEQEGGADDYDEIWDEITELLEQEQSRDKWDETNKFLREQDLLREQAEQQETLNKERRLKTRLRALRHLKSMERKQKLFRRKMARAGMLPLLMEQEGGADVIGTINVNGKEVSIMDPVLYNSDSKVDKKIISRINVNGKEVSIIDPFLYGGADDDKARKSDDDYDTDDELAEITKDLSRCTICYDELDKDTLQACASCVGRKTEREDDPDGICTTCVDRLKRKCPTCKTDMFKGLPTRERARTQQEKERMREIRAEMLARRVDDEIMSVLGAAKGTRRWAKAFLHAQKVTGFGRWNMLSLGQKQQAIAFNKDEHGTPAEYLRYVLTDHYKQEGGAKRKRKLEFGESTRDDDDDDPFLEEILDGEVSEGPDSPPRSPPPGPRLDDTSWQGIFTLRQTLGNILGPDELFTTANSLYGISREEYDYWSRVPPLTEGRQDIISTPPQKRRKKGGANTPPSTPPRTPPGTPPPKRRKISPVETLKDVEDFVKSKVGDVDWWVTGSQAIKHHYPGGIEPGDWDVIVDIPEGHTWELGSTKKQKVDVQRRVKNFKDRGIDVIPLNAVMRDNKTLATNITNSTKGKHLPEEVLEQYYQHYADDEGESSKPAKRLRTLKELQKK